MGRLNEQGLQRLVSNIKEDVNTRIGATNAEVENTKADILGIQNELNKSKSEKYQTVNGTKGFECKDGYIDNVVIEGETLVNIAPMVTINGTNPDGVVRTRFQSIFDSFANNQRYSNGTFTFYNFTDKPIHYVGRNSEDVWAYSFGVEANSCIAVDVPSDKCVVGVDFIPVAGWSNADLSIYKSSMYAVLEGDHTDKPISYFEGLKSVGQGDKIEALSYTDTSSTPSSVIKNGNFNSNTGEDSNSLTLGITDYISIQSDSIRIKVQDGFYMDKFGCFDENKKYICRYGNTIETIPPNTRFIRVVIVKNNKTQVPIDTKVDIYGIKYDKKQILTTLRSLPNGVKDTIEKRGNKYYKIQRCGEVVLDDTLTWSNGNQQTNTRAYRCDVFPKYPSKPLSSIYCDKFIGKTTNEEIQLDTESIYTNTSGSGVKFFLRVANNRLSSSDITGLATWLQTNPVTVVYELATPIMTELPNFNPRTFADKTAVLINSGAVQGDITFDVTSSLGSRIDVMSDKMTTYDIVASNFRNILFSTELPTDNQGNDGDIWIKYI